MPFFYKAYNVSRHAHLGRSQAPNYHPEHSRNLQENSHAFHKKSGIGSLHLDGSKNAVTRKSNIIMDRKFTAAAGKKSPMNCITSRALTGRGISNTLSQQVASVQKSGRNLLIM